jgi:hypothetical protein
MTIRSNRSSCPLLAMKCLRGWRAQSQVCPFGRTKSPSVCFSATARAFAASICRELPCHNLVLAYRSRRKSSTTLRESKLRRRYNAACAIVIFCQNAYPMMAERFSGVMISGNATHLSQNKLTISPSQRYLWVTLVGCNLVGPSWRSEEMLIE